MRSHGLENEKTPLFQGCTPRLGRLPLIPMLGIRRAALLRLLGDTVWRHLSLLGGLMLRLLLDVGRYAHSYKQHRVDYSRRHPPTQSIDIHGTPQSQSLAKRLQVEDCPQKAA